MYAELSLDHNILKDIVENKLSSQPYDGSGSTTPRPRIRSVFDGPVVLLASIIRSIGTSPIRHEMMRSLPVCSKRSKNIQHMDLRKFIKILRRWATEEITNGSTVSIVG